MRVTVKIDGLSAAERQAAARRLAEVNGMRLMTNSAAPCATLEEYYEGLVGDELRREVAAMEAEGLAEAAAGLARLPAADRAEMLAEIRRRGERAGK